MSKGSIRQKGSKWYYRFYIEDENGQHISILILFFMINRSLSRIINIITYFFFDSFIKVKPDKIPLSSANGKRKK